MKILVNGCSHSKVAYSTFRYDKKFLSIGNSGKLLPSLREIQASWQWFLADMLGISDVIGINTHYRAETDKNLASPAPLKSIFEYDKKDCIISLATDGKGNDSIMMDTLYVLREFESRGQKIDLVLIQFSGPTRRLVTSDIKSYAYSNPHENYQFGVNFEPAGSYLTLHNMVILQDYLKKGGYEYYFLSYFPLDSRVEEEPIYTQLDLSKFINYKQFHPIFDGWLENIKKDGLSIDDDGHPNLELMKIIGNKFYNKMLENKSVL